MSDERDEHGRFAPGNPGGPGRPRRAIEREYILCITEAVTLEDWRAIVSRAKEDALAGDDRARAWLAHYLVGDDRISLVELAALEHLGVDVDREIAGLADLIQNPPSLFAMGPEETPLDRALALMSKEQEAEIARLAKAELARRKAARAAEKAAAAGDLTGA